MMDLSVLMCWTTPIFKPSLQFELSCTPVNSDDCVLYGCHIDKILQTSSVAVQTAVGVNRGGLHSDSKVRFASIAKRH